MARPKNYYMVLDTETTAPLFMRDIAGDDENKRKKISIMRPLAYDMSWVICDGYGTIISEKSYVVAEIYYNVPMMEQAFYADRRPLYEERIADGRMKIANWLQITHELIEDMAKVKAVGGYNASFDFFKAIPYTELYIAKSKLSKKNFDEWLQQQYQLCYKIANCPCEPEPNPDYDPNVFCFRGKKYQMFDLWAMSCNSLINNRKYKKFCLDNSLLTNSGEYFKTSAESVFQYLQNTIDFSEVHMGIDDARIEASILGAVYATHCANWVCGATAFPFRKLGKTYEYAKNPDHKKVILSAIDEYLENVDTTTPYARHITNVQLSIKSEVERTIIC